MRVQSGLGRRYKNQCREVCLDIDFAFEWSLGVGGEHGWYAYQRRSRGHLEEQVPICIRSHG
jgi:hypothetical protein